MDSGPSKTLGPPKTLKFDHCNPVSQKFPLDFVIILHEFPLFFVLIYGFFKTTLSWDSFVLESRLLLHQNPQGLVNKHIASVKHMPRNTWEALTFYTTINREPNNLPLQRQPGVFLTRDLWLRYHLLDQSIYNTQRIYTQRLTWQ